jgi:MoaA/NifB/PqqE/SkfB family radical SAM enzyme
MLRTVQRGLKGLPYLRKEVLRNFSVKTGWMWASPSSYYIIVTGRCNFRCPGCPQTPGRTGQDPELSRETMLRIIRESKALSGSGYNISVSGGEPLVYKPIYEAMDLAHKLGVDFGITTNGSLLTSENIKRVLGADPFNINISLESVDPAVNEQLRPSPGSTLKILRAIDELVRAKERLGARFGLFIKPTITEVNYRTLPQMVRHFGRGGGVQVNPQNFYLVPGGEDYWIKDPDNFAAVVEELIALRKEGYGLVPPPEDLRKMVDYFRSPPAKVVERSTVVPQKRCTIGFRNLFIGADGRAYFCEPLGIIGNVNRDSLHELWHGPEAVRRRTAALKCRIDCQITCRRPVSLFTKARAYLRMGN